VALGKPRDVVPSMKSGPSFRQRFLPSGCSQIIGLRTNSAIRLFFVARTELPVTFDALRELANFTIRHSCR
jgi:hypothetical protein